MNRKSLIGIIGLSAILVIATAINRPFFLWIIFGAALIVVWICLVRTVRKKKTKIFHDQMEPELAERRLKILKFFLQVAAISLAVGVVGVVLHNVLSAWLDMEEAVSFVIAILALFLWIMATIGSLVVFIMGRRKPKPKSSEVRAT